MTDTQPAHSKLGASSMYRWAACPGSVRLSQGVENKSSSYADDGTNAHALAAHCLLKGFDPVEFLNGNPHTIDGRTFTVTKSMADAVQFYVDHIRDTREEGDVDMIEVRFDLSAVYPGCFGTADHVRWRARTRTLYVKDYKHGEGLAVEVKGNPQPPYYGLGALINGKYPAEKVVLQIIQPRCDHPDGPIREEEIDAIELLDFRTDLRDYAAATERDDAPLATGSHCRFCPAGRARKCTAIEDGKRNAIRAAFAPGLPYDPAELTKALDSREVVKSWLKNLAEEPG